MRTLGQETRPRHLLEHLEQALETARAEAPRGTVTDRVPALREVEPTRLAMAVATVNGDVVTGGDADTPFSLQSITKLFSLCALLRHDATAWEHVGWGPSQAGYSSVAELERHHGRPRNPFVNSGALVVTDQLHDLTGNATAATIDLIATQSGDGTVDSDLDVAISESIADHRNAAIGHVLAEHGRLRLGVDQLLPQYFGQCAIRASTRTVALAALFLAERGLRPGPLDSSSIRRVNAVLLTSGMYGAAGDIAYRVGLPAKSGIGGGIVAVMPGRGTVCVWSPPLDADGNSRGGIAALEEFARLSGWTVF